MEFFFPLGMIQTGNVIFSLTLKLWVIKLLLKNFQYFYKITMKQKMKLSIFCNIIDKKSYQICIKVQKTSGKVSNNFSKKKRKATLIYFDPPSISQETTRTLKSPYQTQENSRQLLGTPASQNLVSIIYIINQFVLCLH